MKELLDNVSLFWARYFEDYPVLVSLLDGAVAKVSDIKLDNYANLLSSGLDSCPTSLTRDVAKLALEDSNFITIFKNDSAGISGNILFYDLGPGTEFRSIPYLATSPDASTFLECGVDFELYKGDSEDLPDAVRDRLNPSRRYLQFSEDPRTLLPAPVSEQQFYTGVYSIILESIPDDMVALEELDIKYKDSDTTFRVVVAGVKADSKEVILSVSTPLPSDSSLDTATRLVPSVDVLNIVSAEVKTHSGRVTCLWALNPKVDPYLLESQYGSLHSTEFSESSEVYRNFLLGLLSLRNMPLTNKNLVAAVCLCSGVPVFQSSYENGDRIIRVEQVDGGVTIVHTTLAKYVIPFDLTVRPEILQDAIEVTLDGQLVGNRKPADHPQTFEFDVLDSLVSDVVVYEGNKEDSSWWDQPVASSSFVEIPESLMPGEPLARRTIINEPHNNSIGPSSYSTEVRDYLFPSAVIGDYSLKIGDASRNTVAYTLFKDFIRHHFTFVKISPEFLNSTLLSDKPSILDDLQSTINMSSNPGTSVIIGTDLDAALEDVDTDGIPDIIDPEVE